MSAKEPNEYEKRILVAVTGLTPQVVTETLYCLTIKRALAGAKMFRPDKILLLTTGEGRAAIENTLTGKGGKLREFARDYASVLNVPEPTFDRATQIIDVVNAPDVNTTALSARAADTIIETIRGLVAGDVSNQSAIVASIAGGRATMGQLLGYALGVYGRPQDRINHVLVTNSDLENAPQFFYPLPKNGKVHGHKSSHTPGPEVLELSEIPLHPLRPFMPPRQFSALLADDSPFSQRVERLHAVSAQANKLHIKLGDKATRAIFCSGAKLPEKTANGRSLLEDKHYALYAWVARCRKIGKTIDLYNLDDDTLAEYFRVRSKYQSMPLASIKKECQAQWTDLRRGMPEGDYASADGHVKTEFSDLKNAIETTLGAQYAAPFVVTRPGRAGQLFLAVEPENITITE